MNDSNYLIIVFFLSFFGSCRNNHYHIYIDSPNEKLELTGDLFIYSDESFKINYSLGILDNKLIISLSNLTDAMLCVNLAKSFITLNGELFNYSQSYSESGTAFMLRKHNSALMYRPFFLIQKSPESDSIFSVNIFDPERHQYVTIDNDQNIYVPSKSSKTISEIFLKDLIYLKLDSVIKSRRRNSFPLLYDSFDSPLRVTNRFNLTCGVNRTSRNVVNSFYVSEISIYH